MTKPWVIRSARLTMLTLVFVGVFMVRQADAMMIYYQQIERPIDWTFMSGVQRIGIAEEIHVKIGSGSWESRDVLSVGTAVHFGFGAVTIPCRLVVFMSAFVGSIIGMIALTMLPSLRRRWELGRELITD